MPASSSCCAPENAQNTSTSSPPLSYECDTSTSSTSTANHKTFRKCNSYFEQKFKINESDNIKCNDDRPQYEFDSVNSVNKSDNEEGEVLNKKSPTTSLQCKLPLDKLTEILDKINPNRCKIDIIKNSVTSPETSKDVHKSSSIGPPKSLYETNRVVCLYCDRTFTAVSLQMRHAARMHKTSPGRRSSARMSLGQSASKEFPGCTYCAKDKSPKKPVLISGSLADLFDHLIEVHNDKYFACKECTLRFLTVETLNLHLDEVHGSAQVEVVKVLPKIDLDSSKPVAQITTPPPVIDLAPPVIAVDELGIDFEENISFNIISSGKIDDKASLLVPTVLLTKDSQIDLMKSPPILLKSALKSSAGLKRTDEPMLSRLGVAQNRSPRMKKGLKLRKNDVKIQSDKKSKTKSEPQEFVINKNSNSKNEIFDSTFEKDFYDKVTFNVSNNLMNHLDGNIDRGSRRNRGKKSKVPTSSCEIHKSNTMLKNVSAFPTLLSSEQYGIDSAAKIRKKITKNSWKWKWDFIKKYKYYNENGKIVKKIKQPTLGLRDLSKLDMWTQLTMKVKYENIIQRNGDESKARNEKLHQVSELKHIMESRLFPKLNLEQDAQEVSHKHSKSLDQIIQNIKKEEPSDDELIAQESIVLEKSNPSSQDKEDLANSHILASVGIQRKRSPIVTEPSTSSLVNLDYRDMPSTSKQNTYEVGFPFNLNLFPRVLNQPIDKEVDTVLSGEWARPRFYMCVGCGGKFKTLKQVEDHKASRHPYIQTTHYEIVGKEMIDNELYKLFYLPGAKHTGKHVTGTGSEKVTSKNKSDSNSLTCTKCSKSLVRGSEFYRHILECAGDYAWLLSKKKCRYKPFGSRSRRKRGCVPSIPRRRPKPSLKPVRRNKDSGPRVKPSDADSIERMLANLPAKRSSRGIVTMPRPRPRPLPPKRRLVHAPMQAAARVRKRETIESVDNKSTIRRTLRTNRSARNPQTPQQHQRITKRNVNIDAGVRLTGQKVLLKSKVEEKIEGADVKAVLRKKEHVRAKRPTVLSSKIIHSKSYRQNKMFKAKDDVMQGAELETSNENIHVGGMQGVIKATSKTFKGRRNNIICNKSTIIPDDKVCKSNTKSLLKTINQKGRNIMTRVKCRLRSFTPTLGLRVESSVLENTFTDVKNSSKKGLPKVAEAPTSELEDVVVDHVKPHPAKRKSSIGAKTKSVTNKSSKEKYVVQHSVRQLKGKRILKADATESSDNKDICVPSKEIVASVNSRKVGKGKNSVKSKSTGDITKDICESQNCLPSDIIKNVVLPENVSKSKKLKNNLRRTLSFRQCKKYELKNIENVADAKAVIKNVSEQSTILATVVDEKDSEKSNKQYSGKIDVEKKDNGNKTNKRGQSASIKSLLKRFRKPTATAVSKLADITADVTITNKEFVDTTTTTAPLLTESTNTVNITLQSEKINITDLETMPTLEKIAPLTSNKNDNCESIPILSPIVQKQLNSTANSNSSSDLIFSENVSPISNANCSNLSTILSQSKPSDSIKLPITPSRRRVRKLNDCIAMLTGKLQAKLSAENPTQGCLSLFTPSFPEKNVDTLVNSENLLLSNYDSGRCKGDVYYNKKVDKNIFSTENTGKEVDSDMVSIDREKLKIVDCRTTVDTLPGMALQEEASLESGPSNGYVQNVAVKDKNESKGDMFNKFVDFNVNHLVNISESITQTAENGKQTQTYVELPNNLLNENKPKDFCILKIPVISGLRLVRKPIRRKKSRGKYSKRKHPELSSGFVSDVCEGSSLSAFPQAVSLNETPLNTTPSLLPLGMANPEVIPMLNVLSIPRLPNIFQDKHLMNELAFPEKVNVGLENPLLNIVALSGMSKTILGNSSLEITPLTGESSGNRTKPLIISLLHDSKEVQENPPMIVSSGNTKVVQDEPLLNAISNSNINHNSHSLNTVEILEETLLNVLPTSRINQNNQSKIQEEPLLNLLPHSRTNLMNSSQIQTDSLLNILPPSKIQQNNSNEIQVVSHSRINRNKLIDFRKKRNDLTCSKVNENKLIQIQKEPFVIDFISSSNSPVNQKNLSENREVPLLNDMSDCTINQKKSIEIQKESLYKDLSHTKVSQQKLVEIQKEPSLNYLSHSKISNEITEEPVFNIMSDSINNQNKPIEKQDEPLINIAAYSKISNEGQEEPLLNLLSHVNVNEKKLIKNQDELLYNNLLHTKISNEIDHESNINISILENTNLDFPEPGKSLEIQVEQSSDMFPVIAEHSDEIINNHNVIDKIKKTRPVKVNIGKRSNKLRRKKLVTKTVSFEDNIVNVRDPQTEIESAISNESEISSKSAIFKELATPNSKSEELATPNSKSKELATPNSKSKELATPNDDLFGTDDEDDIPLKKLIDKLGTNDRKRSIVKRDIIVPKDIAKITEETPKMKRKSKRISLYDAANLAGGKSDGNIINPDEDVEPTRGKQTRSKTKNDKNPSEDNSLAIEETETQSSMLLENTTSLDIISSAIDNQDIADEQIAIVRSGNRIELKRGKKTRSKEKNDISKENSLTMEETENHFSTLLRNTPLDIVSSEIDNKDEHIDIVSSYNRAELNRGMTTRASNIVLKNSSETETRSSTILENTTSLDIMSSERDNHDITDENADIVSSGNGTELKRGKQTTSSKKKNDKKFFKDNSLIIKGTETQSSALLENTSSLDIISSERVNQDIADEQIDIVNSADGLKLNRGKQTRSKKINDKKYLNDNSLTVAATETHSSTLLENTSSLDIISSERDNQDIADEQIDIVNSANGLKLNRGKQTRGKKINDKKYLNDNSLTVEATETHSSTLLENTTSLDIVSLESNNQDIADEQIDIVNSANRLKLNRGKQTRGKKRNDTKYLNDNTLTVEATETQSSTLLENRTAIDIISSEKDNQDIADEQIDIVSSANGIEVNRPKQTRGKKRNDKKYLNDSILTVEATETQSSTLLENTTPLDISPLIIDSKDIADVQIDKVKNVTSMIRNIKTKSRRKFRNKKVSEEEIISVVQNVSDVVSTGASTGASCDNIVEKIIDSQVDTTVSVIDRFGSAADTSANITCESLTLRTSRRRNTILANFDDTDKILKESVVDKKDHGNATARSRSSKIKQSSLNLNNVPIGEPLSVTDEPKNDLINTIDVCKDDVHINSEQSYAKIRVRDINTLRESADITKTAIVDAQSFTESPIALMNKSLEHEHGKSILTKKPVRRTRTKKSIAMKSIDDDVSTSPCHISTNPSDISTNPCDTESTIFRSLILIESTPSEIHTVENTSPTLLLHENLEKQNHIETTKDKDNLFMGENLIDITNENVLIEKQFENLIDKNYIDSTTSTVLNPTVILNETKCGEKSKNKRRGQKRRIVFSKRKLNKPVGMILSTENSDKNIDSVDVVSKTTDTELVILPHDNVDNIIECNTISNSNPDVLNDAFANLRVLKKSKRRKRKLMTKRKRKIKVSDLPVNNSESIVVQDEIIKTPIVLNDVIKDICHITPVIPDVDVIPSNDHVEPCEVVHILHNTFKENCGTLTENKEKLFDKILIEQHNFTADTPTNGSEVGSILEHGRVKNTGNKSWKRKTRASSLQKTQRCNLNINQSSDVVESVTLVDKVLSNAETGKNEENVSVPDDTLRLNETLDTQVARFEEPIEALSKHIAVQNTNIELNSESDEDISLADIAKSLAVTKTKLRTPEQPTDENIQSVDNQMSDVQNVGNTVIAKRKFKKRGRKSKKAMVVKVQSDSAPVKKKDKIVNMCDICNRTFRSADSLGKHKMTLTHIAKLSEIEAREFFNKKLNENNSSAAVDLESSVQDSEVRLKDTQINNVIENCNENAHTPSCDANSELRQLNCTDEVNNSAKEQESNFTIPSIDLLSERSSKTPIIDITSDNSNLSSSCDSESVSPTKATEFDLANRKSLSVEEALFFECCSLLKSSENTKQDSDVNSTNKNAFSDICPIAESLPTKLHLDLNQFSDISSDSNQLQNTSLSLNVPPTPKSYQDDSCSSNLTAFLNSVQKFITAPISNHVEKSDFSRTNRNFSPISASERSESKLASIFSHKERKTTFSPISNNEDSPNIRNAPVFEQVCNFNKLAAVRQTLTNFSPISNHSNSNEPIFNHASTKVAAITNFIEKNHLYAPSLFKEAEEASVFEHDYIVPKTNLYSEENMIIRTYSDTFSDMGDSYPSSQDASDHEHYLKTITERSNNENLDLADSATKHFSNIVFDNSQVVDCDDLDEHNSVVPVSVYHAENDNLEIINISEDENTSDSDKNRVDDDLQGTPNLRRSSSADVNKLLQIDRSLSNHSSNKKVPTKGALKIFESIKVSIPTSQIDLDQIMHLGIRSKLAAFVDIALRSENDEVKSPNATNEVKINEISTGTIDIDSDVIDLDNDAIDLDKGVTVIDKDVIDLDKDAIDLCDDVIALDNVIDLDNDANYLSCKLNSADSNDEVSEVVGCPQTDVVESFTDDAADFSSVIAKTNLANETTYKNTLDRIVKESKNEITGTASDISCKEYNKSVTENVIVDNEKNTESKVVDSSIKVQIPLNKTLTRTISKKCASTPNVGNRLGFKLKKKRVNAKKSFKKSPKHIIKSKVERNNTKHNIVKDIYEFEDSDDAPIGFGTTTLLGYISNKTAGDKNKTLNGFCDDSKIDNFKRNSKQFLKYRNKIVVNDDDSRKSSLSSSDRNEFNYQSDDYANLTDQSTQNNKLTKENNPKCLIMGRIFKKAVRDDKKNEKSANLDQLFDSLVTKEVVAKVPLDTVIHPAGAKKTVIRKSQFQLSDDANRQRNVKKWNITKRTKFMSRMDLDNLISETDFAVNNKNVDCKLKENFKSVEQGGEIIGVAKRKSQRKCTTGKQNVLAENWSSDDDFERFPHRKEIKQRIVEKCDKVVELSALAVSPSEVVTVVNDKNDDTVSVDCMFADKDVLREPAENNKNDKEDAVQIPLYKVSEAIMKSRKARAKTKLLVESSSDSESEKPAKKVAPRRIKRRRKTTCFRELNGVSENIEVRCQSDGESKHTAELKTANVNNKHISFASNVVDKHRSSENVDVGRCYNSGDEVVTSNLTTRTAGSKRGRRKHAPNIDLDAETAAILSIPRRKRVASEMLYYWSSSSDEDQYAGMIEVKPIRDDVNMADHPIQHGWIVGDSHKKLVTLLAHTKGKKSDECAVKEGTGKKNRVTM